MTIWLALAAAGAAPTALPRTYADVQACRAEPDAAKRLACYDRTVAALDTAQKTASVVVIDRQEVRQARRGLFGFTLPKIGFLTGKGGDDDEVKRLETKVVDVRPALTGGYRVTVEGGAVWEATPIFQSMREPRRGEPVTIERGTLGSYRMKFQYGQPVQGKRVG